MMVFAAHHGHILARRSRGCDSSSVLRLLHPPLRGHGQSQIRRCLLLTGGGLRQLGCCRLLKELRFDRCGTRRPQPSLRWRRRRAQRDVLLCPFLSLSRFLVTLPCVLWSFVVGAGVCGTFVGRGCQRRLSRRAWRRSCVGEPRGFALRCPIIATRIDRLQPTLRTLWPRRRIRDGSAILEVGRRRQLCLGARGE